MLKLFLWHDLVTLYPPIRVCISLDHLNWQGRTHLNVPNSNIIERRYHMSEKTAANTSSYLLAGAIILYPLVGQEFIFVEMWIYHPDSVVTPWTA